MLLHLVVGWLLFNIFIVLWTVTEFVLRGRVRQAGALVFCAVFWGAVYVLSESLLGQKGAWVLATMIAAALMVSKPFSERPHV